MGQTADITGYGVIRAYGAFAESGLVDATPASGSTLTLADHASPVFINTASPLASLTIVMPPTPVHGQEQTIIFRSAVTALAITGNTGQTILTAPLSASANQVLSYIYRSTQAIWLPR